MGMRGVNNAYPASVAWHQARQRANRWFPALPQPFQMRCVIGSGASVAALEDRL